MGILNVTPDSFSDGGKYLKSKFANRQINKLKKEGAEIIDIGGESTRPNSNTIDDKIEWNRVKSKIKYAKKNNVFVSLDTRKSLVLKNSIPLKVNMLNDVSGLNYDDKMISILKKSKIPFVLHHMQGTPKTMQKNPKYKNVTLFHSILSSIVFEFGRVDSPPISIISAPSFFNLLICLLADFDFKYFPPSEKLSGVTFNIPINNGKGLNFIFFTFFLSSKY